MRAPRRTGRCRPGARPGPWGAALLLALLPALGPAGGAAAGEDAGEDAEPSAPERLEADVGWLCRPALKGRRTRPAREAVAAWIAERFRDAGLGPVAGAEGYFFDHGTPEGTGPAEWLRNVAGYLPGAPAAPGAAPAAYLIVSAHYDHLGERTEERTAPDGTAVTLTQRFDGADDNASGVAALLEVARRLGQGPAPARPIVFVAFDLEEQRVLGSQAWVRAEPLPLADCAAFVTLDMLGRSVADLVDGSLFVMGTEHSPALADVVAALGAPEGGRLLALGIDFQPGYSDYLPFQHKQVPFVFVTSGACRDYHSAGDRADRLDYAQLARRTDWVERLVRALAAREERPAWRAEPVPTVAEIEALRGAIREVHRRLPEAPGLPPVAGLLVQNFAAHLDKVLEDGEVTAAERTGARNTTLQLFQMASALGRAR